MDVFKGIFGTSKGLDPNYFIFKKSQQVIASSITDIDQDSHEIKNSIDFEIKKSKSNNLKSLPSFPLDMRNCYQFSDTFIGSKEIETQTFDNTENQTLFLEFADLIISRSDYLNWFLENYGFLSNVQSLHHQQVNYYKIIDPFHKKNSETFNEDLKLYSEPISLWVLAQVRIRTLIRLWRYLKASDFDTVNSYFHLLFKKENNKILLSDEENNQYLEINFLHDSYLRFLENDFKEELKFNISPEIEFNMSNINLGIGSLVKSSTSAANPYLTFANNLIQNFINNIFSPEGLSPNIEFTSGLYRSGLLTNQKSEMNLSYNSMLQKIFYQLMDAIINDKDYTRCLECQKWVEKLEQGKKGKVYCSSSCRNKAYRRRKDIRLIYGYEDPNGKMSINNLILEWYKILQTGDEKKLYSYNRDIEKMLPNKEISKTLSNIKENTLENIIKWTTNKTIAEHLGIDFKLFKNLDEIRESIVRDGEPEASMTYIDWDPNHKW